MVNLARSYHASLRVWTELIKEPRHWLSVRQAVEILEFSTAIK